MARQSRIAPGPVAPDPARSGERASVSGSGIVAAGDFTPAWWLPGPHLQTLWPALVRHPRPVRTTRERFELPDGDFVDLDRTGESGPIVVILHGLQGSSRSSYVRGLLGAFRQRGWRGVVMHFRGCGGEPNRLPAPTTPARPATSDTSYAACASGIRRRRWRRWVSRWGATSC